MSDNIVPHSWSTKTSCLVFVEDMFLINNYKFEVGFDTSSINPVLNDIAFEKIQMFFDILMNNSIIISKSDFDANTFNFKNNYLKLPNLLNDQTLGCVVFSKLMSLVGEDLIIEYVRLSSELGKNIRYTIDNECPEIGSLLPDKAEWWDGTEIKSAPWWGRPDTATYDKVLEGDEIYIGEFNWNEHFEEELKEAENMNTKVHKFQIIKGGRGETE